MAIQVNHIKGDIVELIFNPKEDNLSICPYLDICAPGQKAIQQQKSEKKPLPDNVLADIIAKKIVSKRRQDEATKKKAKAGRSLDELAADLNWS